MTHVKAEIIERETSQKLFGRGQGITILVVILAFSVSLTLWTYTTMLVLSAAIVTFYWMFVGLKLLLGWASRSYVIPAVDHISVNDPDLPIITVFVPLYKEANMLEHVVNSVNALLYPKDKLQVILLLEQADDATCSEAVGMEFDPWFEILVAPTIHIEGTDIVFKGKPKALNLGLEQARGAICVIFDAEDIPEPDQLLKAVSAFRASNENVACVQARLFFLNQKTSWVTRFYWGEYVVHFEWVLPGLAKLGLIPPLGGTSNYFRTDILRKIAISRDKLPKGGEGIGGWDPYNVTEDAELAGAFALYGYQVKMIDSVTYEEATSKLRVADKQRRRWLKGHLQTGLAYTRRPIKTARQMGPVRWFCYVLMMLGTPISLLLNPIMWALTITYFVTRSPLIESLFPPILFYAALFVTIAGNLLLFYQLVAACLHREGYGTVKYLLLTPVWWIFTSLSAYMVLWELARPSTRHMWNKTPHGHDIEKGIQMQHALEKMRLQPEPAITLNKQYQSDPDPV